MMDENMGYAIVSKGLFGLDDSIDFSYSRKEILRKYAKLKRKYPEKTLKVRDYNHGGYTGKIIREHKGRMKKVI